jgi:hypothetical protein
VTDLRNTSGLYLAQYPDWLKIGRATYMRDRLRDHARRGAYRFIAYYTQQHCWPPRVFNAEDVALDLFERRAIRIRSGSRLLEHFTGLTWDEGVEIMREAVTLADGAPVHEAPAGLAELGLLPIAAA